MTYSELRPQKVFSYFKQLSDIPRGSGNEAAAARWVAETAEKLGCRAVVDEANNVFVTASATEGYEDHAPVMLQGHLDMVCEANRDTKHDFLTDPIKLILEGDILRADGTTLGADNGVAVAVMLAILDSDLPHPALECLFTTEEETGLNGMRAFDAKQAKARRMVNLDSAGEGVATVSCAGGVRSHVEFPAEFSPIAEDATVYSVSLNGLAGGHSGEDINLGRIGAISAMARILYAASRETCIRLVTMDGGSRDNAIPRECFAVLAVNDAEAFVNAVNTESDKIRNELVADDCGFKVTVTPAEADSALSCERSSQFITMLRNLPNGIYGMSRQVEGLVETSSNLGVVKPAEGGFAVTVSSRSSVESKLDDMQDRTECAAKAAGASVTHDSRYPGWDYLEGSPLQKLYLDTYKELFGSEASVMGIHAGLECGLLKGKLPDMDMISIGPEIKDLHSPDETLSVSSLERMWNLVCAILKNA